MTIRRILPAAWAAVLLASPPGPAADPPRRDALGDPLPKGAVARIGTGRLRHAAMVQAVTFSPDDSRLASAGQDNAVRVWDPATGKLLYECRGHTNWPAAVAFSPDGKRLASPDWNGHVYLWDAATGRKTRFLTGRSRHLGAVTFSADGRVVRACSQAVALASPVHAWDVANGAARNDIEIATDDNCRPAFSADGALVASSGRDAIPCVWDTAAGKEVLRLPRLKKWVLGIAFSPDGRYLATGGSNPVQVWELATGGLVYSLPAPGDHVFAFAPGGRSLVSAGGDGPIHVWDLATGKKRRNLRVARSVTALAFSHNSRSLAAATREGLIHLLDFATGKERLPSARVPGRLRPLAFLPGGRLAVGSAAGLLFFDVGKAKGEVPGPREVRRLGAVENPVGLSPDGKLALSAPRSGGLVLWDVKSGVELRKLPADHRGQLAFAPDGKTLISTSYGQPRVWEVVTGTFVQRLERHRGSHCAVAFSPDGKLLATATDDNQLRFWDTATWKRQREAPIWGERAGFGVFSTAYSPDGRTVAVADHKGLRLWDVRAARFWDTTLPGCAVVAFSPDGKLLACAGHDHVIRLWDLKTGKVTRELRGHTGRVTDVFFSPDGRLLATGSADHTILLWDVR